MQLRFALGHDSFLSNFSVDAMAKTVAEIQKSLDEVREKLRALLVAHTDMLNARFVGKTMSYTNFIKLSGEIRKDVQEALKQEEILAQQLDNLA
jgi:histidinol-phosphate/aromatic aminotransferase/cobyric acid decarboxylase-like protein